MRPLYSTMSSRVVEAKLCITFCYGIVPVNVVVLVKVEICVLVLAASVVVTGREFDVDVAVLTVLAVADCTDWVGEVLVATGAVVEGAVACTLDDAVLGALTRTAGVLPVLVLGVLCAAAATTGSEAVPASAGLTAGV